MNIMGAPFSTLLCYGTIIVLNFSVLHREIGSLPSAAALFGKPLLCSIVACGGARLLYNATVGALGNMASTVLGIGFAVLAYGVLVLYTKTLHRSDVELLPKGEKLAKLLEKRGWMI